MIMNDKRWYYIPLHTHMVPCAPCQPIITNFIIAPCSVLIFYTGPITILSQTAKSYARKRAWATLDGELSGNNCPLMANKPDVWSHTHTRPSVNTTAQPVLFKQTNERKSRWSAFFVQLELPLSQRCALTKVGIGWWVTNIPLTIWYNLLNMSIGSYKNSTSCTN